MFADFEGATYGDRLDRRPATSSAPRRWPAPSATSSRSAATSGRSWSTPSCDHDRRWAPSPRPRSPSPATTSTCWSAAATTPTPEPPTRRQGPTAVNLIVDGKVVDTATGDEQRSAELAVLERVRAAGQQAQIQIVDQNTGGWGHLNVDNIVFSAKPRPARQHRDRGRSARRRAGRRLGHRHQRRGAGLGARSTCGPTRASRRRSRSSTQNTGGWGHLNADQFMFATRAGAVQHPAGALGRLRRGLLRRHLVQRRPRRPADPDRLDEQLELRRQHPHRRRGAARTASRANWRWTRSAARCS